MASASQSRKIKTAARALMSQEPGLTYTQARARVIAALAADPAAPPTATVDGLSGRPATVIVDVSRRHVPGREWGAAVTYTRLSGGVRVTHETDSGTTTAVTVTPTREYDPDAFSERCPSLAAVLAWATGRGASAVRLTDDAPAVEGVPLAAFTPRSAECLACDASRPGVLSLPDSDEDPVWLPGWVCPTCGDIQAEEDFLMNSGPSLSLGADGSVTAWDSGDGWSQEMWGPYTYPIGSDDWYEHLTSLGLDPDAVVAAVENAAAN